MTYIRKIVKYYGIILVIFFVWAIGSYLNLWNRYIIPYPQDVFKVIVEMIYNGELLNNAFVSLSRVIVGFTISFFIAFPLGVFFGIKKEMIKSVNAILEFLRHTPPLALIPMLILWFGIGEMSKIILIILASFFPIFLNVLKGISTCDEKLLEVGISFGFTKKQQFIKIIFPNAFLDIVTGMKLGFGYSWRAIIGAELIAASSGLGYMILDAQQLSRSDKVVVGILTIGIMGMLTDYIFAKLINRFVKR